MSNDSPAVILYDGYGNPITIINGAVAISNISNNGNISYVGTAIVDTLLLDLNANRRGVFIYNNTTSAVLKLGLSSIPVSSTFFSVSINAGGLFEIPFGYTGQIHGIWSIYEADGYVLITELV